MTTKRINVLVDGVVVYAEDVDAGEYWYAVENGRIRLSAGPGTTAAFLQAIWSGIMPRCP